MIEFLKKSKLKPTENIWEQLIISNVHYIVTSNSSRSKYYIYMKVDDDWKRLGVGSDPPSLIKRYVGDK